MCDWIGDTLNVYISTQYVWGVRDEIAEALGLPADKVRVVCEYMGGGFGSKNDAGEYTFAAAELAKRTGRPVRAALTRREENIAAGNRNATIQKLTVGARSDGTIVALGGEFINAVGWTGWSAMTDQHIGGIGMAVEGNLLLKRWAFARAMREGATSRAYMLFE